MQEPLVNQPLTSSVQSPSSPPSVSNSSSAQSFPPSPSIPPQTPPSTLQPPQNPPNPNPPQSNTQPPYQKRFVNSKSIMVTLIIILIVFVISSYFNKLNKIKNIMKQVNNQQENNSQNLQNPEQAPDYEQSVEDYKKLVENIQQSKTTMPIYPGSRQIDNVVYAVKADSRDVAYFYIDEFKKLGFEVSRADVDKQIEVMMKWAKPEERAIIIGKDEANFVQIGMTKDKNEEISYAIVAGY